MACPARTRRGQLRVVLGDRRRDDHLRALGQVCGVVADHRIDPRLAKPRAVGRLGLVRAGDARAELRARRAPGRSSPRRRSRRSAAAGRRSWPAHTSASTSSATRSAASGLATASRGVRHLRHPLRRRQQAAHLAREPRAVQLVVRDHDRRARLVHEAGVRGLVVAGRVRVGHEDRGQARRGELEDRSAGARGGEVGRGERVGERLDVRRTAGSAPASRARRAARAASRSRGGPRRAAPCRAPPPPNASSAASFSRRAPSEPPNTSRHGPVGRDAEPLARGVAVGAAGARGHRPAGDDPLRAARARAAGTPGTRAPRTARAAGSTRPGGCPPR